MERTTLLIPPKNDYLSLRKSVPGQTSLQVKKGIRQMAKSENKKYFTKGVPSKKDIERLVDQMIADKEQKKKPDPRKNQLRKSYTDI